MHRQSESTSFRRIGREVRVRSLNFRRKQETEELKGVGYAVGDEKLKVGFQSF